jgi:hypothetical protein
MIKLTGLPGLGQSMGQLAFFSRITGLYTELGLIKQRMMHFHRINSKTVIIP